MSETSKVFVKRTGVWIRSNKGTTPMGGLGLIFLLESFSHFDIITPVSFHQRAKGYIIFQSD